MTTRTEAKTWLTLGDISERLLQAGHLADSPDAHNTVRGWRKNGTNGFPDPDGYAGEKRPQPLWDPETVSAWIDTLEE